MIAYHAVTDAPLHTGQELIFDAEHVSGVFLRVREKLNLVRDIQSNPEKYRARPLGYHTAIALRELAMEEVRAAHYPNYPSRMSCLYAAETLEGAEKWADFFEKIGRPVFAVARVESMGRVFAADASKIFEGQLDHRENLRLAELYWRAEAPIVPEILMGDHVRVVEILNRRAGS